MTDIPYDSMRQRLADQRIILIGGAGFIGHNLALELARLGAAVMVVDNLMLNSLVDSVYVRERHPVQRQAYQTFLLDRFAMMREAGIHLRNADARHVFDIELLFQEFLPTKVVHLSAISSAVDARKNPGLCFDVQLLTLRNVLELSRLFAAKDLNQVLLMSSSTVYGDFETPTVDESARPRPKGIYATTKFMAERLVRVYRDQYNLGTTIIRPSALYGERCISRRVSQMFIENALVGKPLLLEGGGDGRLDFTYIGDLVDGLVRSLALHVGPISSSTYNITFGRARTILELAKVVKSVVPGAMLEERPRAEDKPIRGTLSTERAERELGFKARWSLEDGYKRYCEWYVAEWERAKRSVSGA